MSYVIFALTGDYSKVAEEVEKELSKEKSKEMCRPMIEKLSVNDLRELTKKLIEANSEKDDTISLMKEELNELYVKYDALCAAFGEMNHFVQEAGKVAERHSIEN